MNENVLVHFNLGDAEDEMMMTLSGIQHFAFCRRQWALIFIEQQWQENVHTADGQVFHQRAHDDTQIEMRGDTLIVRGLRVRSKRLNVTGICDVVEFRKSKAGITLAKREGKYSAYPVEYKKGAPKAYAYDDADKIQLCAQAMCLEEMLVCDIPEGSLYYGQPRRRERVILDEQLRIRVEDMLTEMNTLYARGYTPKVKPHKGCSACSLKDICLPKLNRVTSVEKYISAHVCEENAQ